MKIIKTAQNKVSYTAVVSPESIEQNKVAPWSAILSQVEIPNGWKIHAHHMTMYMGECKDRSLIGKTIELEIIGVGKDENVMALLVRSPLSNNKRPHITIATAPGKKPFLSNKIPDENWKPLEFSMSVQGTIAEVGFQGEIIQQEKIPGGLSSGKNPEDFDHQALSEGTKVELEHTSDPAIAQEIAMDHLTEDPNYYTKESNAR